jgi:tRNA-2-methylthio-N6-dimethylallyladenosine synthase
MLERMNRRHGVEHYLKLVERLRRVRPDLALSSDFIVGFPGESEADFAATLALVDRVGFAQAYSFKYSPRPGTPAALLDEQIPEPLKEERLQRLQDRIADGQRRFNRQALGRRLSVLAERTGRRLGQLIGRSPHMQSVHFTAPADRLGRLVEIEVIGAYSNSLAGRMVEPAPIQEATA